MSRQIRKYSLSDKTSEPGIKEITIKLDHERPVIADFEIQRGIFCIWVESEFSETEDVTFRIYETGDDIVEGDKFIKTIHHTGWVWHLYMKEEDNE